MDNKLELLLTQLNEMVSDYNKENKEKNDIDFVVRAYGEYINTLGDTEFEINQAQYDKFNSAVRFFQQLVEKNNGKMEPIVLIPHEISCGATATFSVLSLWGEDIQKLQSIIGDISAFDIDVQGDKVCISFSVPNVFAEKTK
jgi:hypothetical protein